MCYNCAGVPTLGDSHNVAAAWPTATMKKE